MEIIEILKAALFGVVEGVTEWLPMSSTGHMILLNEFVKLNVSDAFWSMFEVVIQLGAILAVVVVFWNNIWPFGQRNNRHPLAESGPLSFVKMDIIRLWVKIIIACVPAAVIGLAFNDKFEELFYNFQTVAIALIVFGVLFIIVENRHKGKKGRVRRVSQITWQMCLVIGLFQLIAAIFPGTSRSGATIIGALLIGVSRVAAAEFTFYLAIPVMFGASLLKIAKFGLHFTTIEAVILLVGMAVAFIVSIIVIKFLMGYIKKHDFKVFGWYRIVLGILVLAYFGISTLAA